MAGSVRKSAQGIVSLVGKSGETPESTVKVRMGENGERLCMHPPWVCARLPFVPRVRLEFEQGRKMGKAAITSLEDTGPSPEAIARGFERALTAARQFEGATAPNPAVGCVLLDREGDVIAVGAHEKAGLPHAEAAAIASAEAKNRLDDIHTAIVTLEPCNHTGRTGPCSEAILRTPTQAVWIGTMDPNPKVAGGGAARLAAAGLDVRMIADLDVSQAAELANDAARLIAPFAKHQLTGLPFVTVKQALNRDGSMVPPKGQTTFTSEASLDLAHQMRRRAGAILTGSGTILADDPAFTVRRVPDFAHVQRRLVILDRRGRVSQDYVAAAGQRGFEVWQEVDVKTALEKLGAAGVLEVLVEAGPEVTQAFVEANLWDEHVVITQGAKGGEDDVTIRQNPNAEWLRSA